MIEIVSISKFLDVFQKAFGLIEKRREKKRQLFTDVIDPIYAELTVIVVEYYEFFRGCRDAFEKAEFENFARPQGEKEGKRRDCYGKEQGISITEAFLIPLDSQTEESKDQLGRLLYDYAKEIAMFFYSSHNLTETEAGTLFESIQDFIDDGDPGCKPTAMICIGSSLKSMESNWKNISTTYGKLKLHCLG